MHLLFYIAISAILALNLALPQTFGITLFLVILFIAICVGVSGTVTTHLALSSRHATRRFAPTSAFNEFHKYLTDGLNHEQRKTPDRLPVVFGRSVDIALQDLLDLVVCDLISPWLPELAFNSKALQLSIKSDIWYAMGKLRERLTNIDETKLIAVNVVSRITSHFEMIRISQSQATGDEHGQIFLSHHLGSLEKELGYLRKLAELLLVTLFPRSSVSPSVNKSLLIEVLACKVLAPCVNLLTDPDYINQKVVEYVEQAQKNQDLHRLSYAHAQSYVDFIQLIRASDNVEHLKHIRYTIMTEIMQATTIQNLKKVKGLEHDRDQESGKKLRKYLGQLSFAKAQCEARLQAVDCAGFADQEATSGLRVEIPLQTILESVQGRKRLGQFLELSGEESLLTFWAAVEELRSTDKKNWHQIGAEIYYTFLHSPLSVIKVERPVRRRIESFLLGDTGPEVFCDVQETVVEKLNTSIYPAFLNTDLYVQYLQDVDAANLKDLSEESQLFGDDEKEHSVLEQTGYARTKLSQLDEKLSNKAQALQALRASLKPESKVLSGLEKEVEYLEGEKRQLEAHLSRTEAWGEHLGKWRAVVQSIEIPDEKEQPQFVLVVHAEHDEESEDISTGWVVLRKLSEFHDLHRKISPLWAAAKQLELPSHSSKFIFGKQMDTNSKEKAKVQIQKYLESILKEESVNACEALYAFLSPSSEHLKGTVGSSGGLASPKKTRFSLSTLFKGANATVGSDGSRESDDEDGSLLDDGLGSVEGKDAVAEPLYALLGEIFDLRGVFRWLRKSLITFVQITYGRTISRQVGETVAWLISEPMVLYYMQLFTQAWWPNGCLTQPPGPRTAEEKLSTRQNAKVLVKNNTPEVLNNLVGLQNARRGMMKILETVQDVRLNKQLFYDLLELVIYELFPELQQKRTALSTGRRGKAKPVP